MKVLNLFSGIGGFFLGLERAGMQTVAFCEVDSFCQKVLKKHWPEVPIYDDIRNIRQQFTGAVDLICGGYPCQPFSNAGQRKGQKDDRHLWPEMFACIQQYRPRWIIGENVVGHVNLGLDDVLSDLESEGYAVRAFIIPACAVVAPHRRDRVWIIAYSDSQRQPQLQGLNQNIGGRPDNTAQAVTNDSGERGQGSLQESLCGQQAFSWCKDVQRTEDYFNRPDIPQPLICREDDGFSGRVDRLRALGNAVVPQIVEIIGTAIMQIKGNHKNKL